MNNLRCDTCDHESDHHGELGCEFTTCSCDEFKAQEEKEETIFTQNSATQNTREKLEKWEVNPKAFKKKSSMSVKQESNQHRQLTQSEIWDKVEANWVKIDELTENKEYEKVDNEIDFILEKKFDNISAWMKKGHNYINLSRYSDSIVCYNNALILDNKETQKFKKINYEILNSIAIAHSYEENYSEAIIYGKKSLIIKDDYIPALTELGYNYRYTHDYELSKEQYKKILKIEINNVDALDNLGWCYYKLNEIDKAIKCFNKSKMMEKNPHDLYADMHLAECYIKKKDFEHAEILLNNQKIIEHDNAYSCMLRGEAQKLSKKFDEAIINYEKELSLYNSTRSNVWFDLGYCYGELGNNRVSVEYYKKYVEIDKLTSACAQNIGFQLAANKEYEEAIKWYDKGLEKYPDDVDILNNKSKTCEKLGRYEEAIDCYDKILENEPENFWILNNKFNAFVEIGKNDEAIEGFKLLLSKNRTKDDPPDELLLNNMGWSCIQNEEYEKGLTYVEDALKLDSEKAYILDSKAVALYSLKRYEEAMKYYDKKYEISKNETDRIWIGICLRQLSYQEDNTDNQKKQYCEDAIKVFNLTLKINPNHPYALLNKGISNLELKKYDEAKLNILQGIKSEPNAEIFWSNLGQIARLEKKYDQSIMYYDVANSIESIHWNSYINGKNLVELKRYEEAITYFDKFLEFNYDVDVIIAKGNALYLNGMFEEAIDCYDKILENEPENNFALSNKGNALRAIKKYEKSKKILDKAIELDPTDFYNFDTKSLLYQEWGKYEKALELNEQMLKEFPNDIEQTLEHFITTYKKMDNHEMVKEYKEKLQKLKDLK